MPDYTVSLSSVSQCVPDCTRTDPQETAFLFLAQKTAHDFIPDEFEQGGFSASRPRALLRGWGYEGSVHDDNGRLGQKNSSAFKRAARNEAVKYKPRSVAFVRQRHVSSSQIVEHSQGGHAAVNGMTALDSYHAGNPSCVKGFPNVWNSNQIGAVIFRNSSAFLFESRLGLGTQQGRQRMYHVIW